MNKDAITVHAMFPIAHHQTQTTSRIHADTVLLARGRAIARAGCEMAGWRIHDTISARTCESSESLQLLVLDHSITGCTFLSLGYLRNAFIYSFPPPLASTTADVPSIAVKEWNTRPSESEIFHTIGLRPFESTLFNPPPSQPLIGPPVLPVQDQNQEDSPQPPKKRLKINLDEGPIDELIPPVQVHLAHILTLLTTIHQAPLHPCPFRRRNFIVTFTT